MADNGNGKLETIWVKRMRRGPMDVQESARLIAGKGLQDDANFGKKRQVTILSREQWDDICQDLGQDLDPAVRRANFLVSGVVLPHSRGRTLRIGDSRILIHGETRPCRQIDESHRGLREAMDPEWRGGVYGEVVTGGEIAPGDEVRWEDSFAGKSSERKK